MKMTGQNIDGPWITGCYPVYESQAQDYKPVAR